MTILTDEEINVLVKEAAQGSAIKRDGSTSQRIARAVEQVVLEKLKQQRDELLAALEQIANESTRNLGSARIIARAAIARVKGGAAR